MCVGITVANSRVLVDSPYDRGFISRAKEMGGKWDPDGKVWAFDERDEERVRDLCMEIYGEDGRDSGTTVAIRLDLEAYDNDIYEQELRLAGRQLAKRFGRDQAVALGDGIVLVEGHFKKSGGSRKNPRIGETKGVVLEIRDLKPTVVEKMVEEAGKAVEVLANEDTAKLAALEKLRSALAHAMEAGVEPEVAREMIDSFEEVPF